MLQIETDRLILRPFLDTDIDRLLELRSNPEIMQYISRGKPHTIEMVNNWMKKVRSQWEHSGFGFWGAVHNGDKRLIGWCGLDFLDYTTEVEVGYGIDKAYWGRGLMTEGAEAALRFGFEKIGLDRICAVAIPENIGSRRVMEKAGMRYVKMAEYYNENLAYYEMTREEFHPGKGLYKLGAVAG